MAKHSVGIRELSHSVSAVVSEVERTGEPVVITRHGHPAAAIFPVSGDRLQALILQLIPHLVRDGFARADEDLAAGRTYALEDVLAELDRLDSEESGVADEDPQQRAAPVG
ncbi:MAG: type II toxin-antitoxin system Phd/YefM family antitoxin [Solirubrobacterales bacterium]|nr:type II toxin-antitoxin system Phd/YefM family antitoxin [Solirubrobacterales bacterium]